MTSKYIQWDKFDEMLKASEQTNNDFNRLDEIAKEKRKLYEKKQKLENEENEINKRYRQNYTDKLNDRLDNYGILTVITSTDEYEAHIISVTNDNMKIRYFSNYGSNKNEFEISIQNLKEKGYVKHEAINDWDRTCYIVDKIKNPLYVFEIIKFRLKEELEEVLNSISYKEKVITEYNHKLKKLYEQKETFKKIPDSKITKVFNNISFGVTDLKINDILKSLPREISLIVEENNE